ncbi:hypothetical protein QBC47DRAFT_50113 [Echria macrotheca]|uniref:Uncharacterized protein n=1 Tax=Echria macrotheca TaxID=438768 RepID=A0AAJ0B8Z6_9PEZI|nr:hypothetical protein QBC47DRAFT_50113 [Echria macrotheca]
MRLSVLFLSLGLSSGALAACDWYLQPDDCICMNSTNGALLKSQTATVCRFMGYRTASSICGVDREARQEFKDNCKGLNQENVIGHCR